MIWTSLLRLPWRMMRPSRWSTSAGRHGASRWYKATARSCTLVPLPTATTAVLDVRPACVPGRSVIIYQLGPERPPCSQVPVRRACGSRDSDRPAEGPAAGEEGRPAVVDDRLAGGDGPSAGGPVPPPARRVGHPADLRLPAGRSSAVAGPGVPGSWGGDAAGSRAVYGDRRRRGGDAAGRAVAGRQASVWPRRALDGGGLPEGLLPASGLSRGEW